jgi:hypothetical protein
LRSDIVVSYSSDEIRKPIAQLFSSKDFKSEVAAHISFVPRLSEELKVEEEIKEESKDMEAEESEEQSSEITSGEFIFLIDRSHSMGGERMVAARKALELFVKSLPQGSMFNIVSFGTQHYKFFEESADFTEENLKEFIDSIDEFRANMRGTNILDPLKSIYSEKRDSKSKLMRHLFLLTDGGVEDTDEVLKIIEQDQLNTRVHTFGIGSGASPILVYGAALAGLGNAFHSPEYDPLLNTKVIDALRQATMPAYTQLKINFGENQDSLLYEVPNEISGKCFYEEIPIHLSFIFDKEKFVDAPIELEFHNSLSNKVDKYEVILKK